MKNKKFDFENKKIIIILILVLLVIFIVIGNLMNKNKNYSSVDDFQSVEELVEYYGCTYIKTVGSDEDGYDKDIYITFSQDPVSETGYSKKDYYENIISKVEAKVNNKKIRIIDESRNITIRVEYSSEKKLAVYTINNISNYFSIMQSKYQIENAKNIDITNVNIKSGLINSLISNNWSKKDVNLAKSEATCDDYDIYNEAGYKIRNLNGKVYNIVFTKKYTEEIFENVKTGMSNNEVEKILGSGTFKDTVNKIIGYKTDNLYVFFRDGEVSIYRVEKVDEANNTKFSEIVTKLNKTGDYKTFLNSLTDIYPDYSEYIQSDSYISIKYPLKGLEIKFGAKEGNGIILYNNYQGKIAENVTIDDVKKNKVLPVNVYTQLDTDMVFQDEQTRTIEDYENRHPNDGIELLATNKYIVLNKGNDMYSFYSIDKTNIDSTKRITNFTNIKSINDTTFAYGIENDGIYTYNTQTQETKKIASGTNEKFTINSVDAKTIKYDGNKSANI